jgi:hypothetical protein
MYKFKLIYWRVWFLSLLIVSLIYTEFKNYSSQNRNQKYIYKGSKKKIYYKLYTGIFYINGMQN